MKLIDISTKKHPSTFSMVDDGDFAYLNQWKWRCNNSGKGYAVRFENGRTVHMHRVINNTPEEYQTDHIDRNPLNNQRKNLRTVTPCQNQLNSSIRSDNKSKYKGVGWSIRCGMWRARITIEKKQVHLGYYLNINDAVNARKKAEKEWLDLVS